MELTVDALWEELSEIRRLGGGDRLICLSDSRLGDLPVEEVRLGRFQSFRSAVRLVTDAMETGDLLDGLLDKLADVLDSDDFETMMACAVEKAAPEINIGSQENLNDRLTLIQSIVNTATGEQFRELIKRKVKMRC